MSEQTRKIEEPVNAMPYHLVPVTGDNVGRIVALERECFSRPWSREMLLEELEDLSASFIAAQAEDGTILGYAGLTVVLDEGYINNVAVGKRYRRQGVASALLGTFQRFARSNGLAFLTLEVRESNAAALRLYESLGFSEAGRRKNYYEDPRENAILMTWRPV